MKSATYGNGLIETLVLNPRLQPCRIATNSTGTAPASCADSNNGNILDFSYGFGTADNGNIASWSATGQQTFNRTYTYDSLNRLKAASFSSNDPSGCTNTSWVIDPWGNITGENPNGGCYSWSEAVNSNNQFAAGVYDAAGNLRGDGTHTYSYDLENRIQYVDNGNTALYVYDADGRRVAKGANSVVTYYIYHQDGQVAAEMNATNQWVQSYLYFGGRPLGFYRGIITAFYHQDHLGSTRLITLGDQSIYDNMDYMPFGWQITGASNTTHKFTGKERDSESGLDYFGARYHSSQWGRFMSPDQLGPGQHPENPQTWNLYSYVLNNPLKLVDPSGEFTCDTKTVSDQQCDNFQAALDKAQQAADKIGAADNCQWQCKKYLDAQRAIDSYGDEDVDNGVVIAQGDSQATKGYSAYVDAAGKAFPGEKLVLTFDKDLKLLDSTDNPALAITAGHEGSHVADDMQWINTHRSDGLPQSIYQFELNGYSVGNSIAEGLGFSSVTYFGKYNFPVPLTPAGQDRTEIMIKREYPNWNLRIFSNRTNPSGLH